MRGFTPASNEARTAATASLEISELEHVIDEQYRRRASVRPPREVRLRSYTFSHGTALGQGWTIIRPQADWIVTGSIAQYLGASEPGQFDTAVLVGGVKTSGSWEGSVVANIRASLDQMDRPKLVPVTSSSSLGADGYEVALEASMPPTREETLRRVRDDLQAWFAASMVDVARLTGVSYATIANLAKKTRGPRPGSLQKIFAVYDRAKELRRTWGSEYADAWLRTVGRDTLLAKKRARFDRMVDEIIFPPTAIKRTRFAEESELMLNPEFVPPKPAGARRR